jgi:hypothetical protein
MQSMPAGVVLKNVTNATSARPSSGVKRPWMPASVHPPTHVSWYTPWYLALPAGGAEPQFSIHITKSSASNAARATRINSSFTHTASGTMQSEPHDSVPPIPGRGVPVVVVEDVGVAVLVAFDDVTAVVVAGRVDEVLAGADEVLAGADEVLAAVEDAPPLPHQLREEARKTVECRGL